MPRYAVYFAPEPASALWRYGSGIIGYDAASGRDVPFLDAAGRSMDAWRSVTDDPRRYGFHATLKAPFELADAMDEARVLADVGTLAGTLRPVHLPGLVVAEIGRFIALVPAAPSLELQALAAGTVEELDHLRSPLSLADRARRLKSPLSPRQIAYLDRYGYPYVLDEFRFHMTLTGPIADPTERSGIRVALASAYAKACLAGPVVVDALTVFRQERRDGRFRIIARFPFRAQPPP